MIRNTIIQISAVGAAALMLTACGSPRYASSVPGDTPDPIAATQAPPVAYRGSQEGMVVVSGNDVAINGQVVSAVSALPEMHEADVQVATLNGVVSMRGTVPSQSSARQAVEAARQVPGVVRVDYDLQVR